MLDSLAISWSSGVEADRSGARIVEELDWAPSAIEWGVQKRGQPDVLSNGLGVSEITLPSHGRQNGEPRYAPENVGHAVAPEYLKGRVVSPFLNLSYHPGEPFHLVSMRPSAVIADSHRCSPSILKRSPDSPSSYECLALGDWANKPRVMTAILLEEIGSGYPELRAGGENKRTSCSNLPEESEGIGKG